MLPALLRRELRHEFDTNCHDFGLKSIRLVVVRCCCGLKTMRTDAFRCDIRPNPMRTVARFRCDFGPNSMQINATRCDFNLSSSTRSRCESLRFWSGSGAIQCNSSHIFNQFLSEIVASPSSRCDGGLQSMRMDANPCESLRFRFEADATRGDLVRFCFKAMRIDANRWESLRR